MHRKVILALLLTLGAAWVWGTQVSADTIRKSITPHLIFDAQYDSNFYKTPTEETGAWTYIIRPGLEAEIETEKSFAAVYYTLDGYSYGRLDEDLDFIGHNFKLKASTRTRSDRLHLNLRETYLRTRDPAELDYLNNYVSTYEYSINRFDPEIIYDLGRSTIRIAYGNVLINYKEADSGTDSVENRGAAEWRYLFNRANAFGLNYQYWTVDYDGPESDYDSQQAKVIYERQGKRLKLDTGAGWQGRKFDEAGLDDTTNFVWDISLRTKDLKNTDIIFRADGNLNNWGIGSGYYDATKLALTVRHDFVRDLRGGIYCSFQNSDYELTDRDDDTWNFEASLGYTITRWLAVSGALGIETRNSSLDAAEYDNFYGIAMFSLIYPIGTGSPVILPSHYN